ncbi:MAG: tetratricopeptide repeat protein [Bosea sp. (in: a-proteobacteria)]
MRIFERLAIGAVVLGLFAPAAAIAQSQGTQGSTPPANPLSVLPAPPPGSASAVPLAPFGSVKEALRAGVRDYNSGNKIDAVRALEFAAGQGHLTAQWKLGRMFAAGDGVPGDDLKAFEYFSKIADENADEMPGTVDSKMVSGAFVALGHYFRAGIAGSYVKPSPARAYEMYHYAATYFRDPDAQMNLGKLYLDTKGASRDPRQAARWLKLAAEKSHPPAQALLGDLLVRGDGVPRQTAEGLMWLMIAKDSSALEDADWISDLHARAMAQSQPTDREAAMFYMRRHNAKTARP